MDAQKELFYKLLETARQNRCSKKQETFYITSEKCKLILETLKEPKGVKCDNGSKFKFWCFSNFKSVKIGSKSILYSQKTDTPVVPMEDIFDTIKL